MDREALQRVVDLEVCTRPGDATQRRKPWKSVKPYIANGLLDTLTLPCLIWNGVRGQQRDAEEVPNDRDQDLAQVQITALEGSKMR